MFGGVKRQISRTTAIYIAIGVTLMVIMTLIGLSAFLGLVEFEIIGASVYSIEEVIEASEVSFGDNLMSINTREISQRVRTALPIVNSVKVSRSLPGTLVIEVTESFAIASISFAGDFLVIDVTGRVIDRLNESPAGLIEIRGVEINDAVLGEVPVPESGGEVRIQNMQDILAIIEREAMDKDVSYLDVSNANNLHFGYHNIYSVLLGRARDLRHKMGILPDMLSQVQSQMPNTPGVIDLSDPSGDVKFTPN
jgi:cell division protein FtsQ